MNFVKNYLKYVILGAVLAVIAIVVGALNIKDVCYAEEQKSSYTRTKFDFYINAPSGAQISQLQSEQSVSSIFPYYLFSNAFTGNKSREIGIIVFEDDKNADISLLSSGTLIKGEYDPDGIMLDVTASKLLNVGVGDTLSFNILGTSYSKPVSALYLASTYPGLNRGLIMVKATDALKQSKLFPKSYSGALLVSSDRTATDALLKNYVGEGNIMSFEEYEKLELGNMTKPSNITEEEFAAQKQAKYDEYRETTIADYKKGGAQTANKATQYQLVKDQILTTEKKINTNTIITSVALFVLFLIVGAVFIVTNMRNDGIRRDGGRTFMRTFGGYALVTLIPAVAVALVTLIPLMIIASGTYFFGSCLTTVLALTFAPVAALPLVVLVAFIYTKILYSSSAEL